MCYIVRLAREHETVVSSVCPLLARTDDHPGVRPLPPLQLEAGRAAPELHLGKDEARVLNMYWELAGTCVRVLQSYEGLPGGDYRNKLNQEKPSQLELSKLSNPLRNIVRLCLFGGHIFRQK